MTHKPTDESGQTSRVGPNAARKVYADINSVGDTYIQVTLSGGEHVHNLTEPQIEAILEAALSTDAEPVAYRVRMVGQVWQLRHVIHEFDKWDIVDPLYAAPPALSVAVKAPTRIELANAINAKIVEVNERVYGKNRADWRMLRTSEIVDAVQSALSAQVQG